MNKKVVNDAIPYAYKALDESKIAVNGCIDKKFRSQISSFGAAITMGSLMSAVAFFSDKGSAEVDREKLMKAILVVLKKQEICGQEEYLFEYVNRVYKDAQQGKQAAVNRATENIINASIALKLAMNLYTLN